MYYRKLHTSEAGQIVLNLSIALLLHHVSLFVQGVNLFTATQEDKIPILCLLAHSSIIYTGLVIAFLMASEALNAFVKIVLVFQTIDKYVLKAAIVSWSKLIPSSMPHIFASRDHSLIILTYMCSYHVDIDYTGFSLGVNLMYKFKNMVMIHYIILELLLHILLSCILKH